jgi:hypothetical protein
LILYDGVSLPTFSKAEADYLVAAPKFIRAFPKRQFLNARRMTGWLLQTRVFSASEPNEPIAGLVIKARLHQAPIGLPRLTPSAALEWYGVRIRGINWELWHDNPDGTIVKGWHEHLWSPDEQDERVVAARPEPRKRDLFGLFKWGLKQWNIEVTQGEEQATLDELSD